MEVHLTTNRTIFLTLHFKSRHWRFAAKYIGHIPRFDQLDMLSNRMGAQMYSLSCMHTNTHTTPSPLVRLTSSASDGCSGGDKRRNKVRILNVTNCLAQMWCCYLFTLVNFIFVHNTFLTIYFPPHHFLVHILHSSEVLTMSVRLSVRLSDPALVILECSLHFKCGLTFYYAQCCPFVSFLLSPLMCSLF